MKNVAAEATDGKFDDLWKQLENEQFDELWKQLGKSETKIDRLKDQLEIFKAEAMDSTNSTISLQQQHWNLATRVEKLERQQRQNDVERYYQSLQNRRYIVHDAEQHRTDASRITNWQSDLIDHFPGLQTMASSSHEED